jgi:predicted ATPase
MTSKWYVITGAPSSGKTTIINSLAKMGYHTIPEVARTVIDEEMKKGKKIEEIRKNEIEFQRKVLEIKIKIEKELSRDKIVFFDRGIPDSIAYLQICGLNPEEVLKFCIEKNYRKIFILEKLQFEKDYARVEDDETVDKLQVLLRKAYLDLEYEIIDVPIMPIGKRLKIILSNL